MGMKDNDIPDEVDLALANLRIALFGAAQSALPQERKRQVFDLIDDFVTCFPDEMKEAKNRRYERCG